MLDDEPARGLRQGADPPGPRDLIGADPAHRLPEAAKRYWQVALAGPALVAAAIGLAVGDLAEEIGLPGWLPVALALVLGVLAIVLIPPLRWSRWRYEVREEEIDLRHGLFTIRRTLVPIRRVQHVDTATSWLQGEFDLATVTFHTAAGATEIPAVHKSEAEGIRMRVAELARTRDDV